MGITTPEDHETQENYKFSFSIWDVPSICIFNPDVITNVKSFKNDHVKLDLPTTISLIRSFIKQQYTNEQILTELKEQAAQLAAEKHYQQKLQEHLPLYLHIIHLQTERDYKIRKVIFSRKKDATEQLDSIDAEYDPQLQPLINQYFSFLDELYMIKHKKTFDDESQKRYFQSNVEAQFRKLLEKQLLAALQARNAAKIEHKNAQQLHTPILPEEKIDE